MESSIDPQILMYGLLVLFLLIGTILTAIVCCFLRGKKRSKAVNVLLVFATLSSVANIAGTWLPSKEFQKEISEIVNMEYVHQADLMGSSLKECVCYNDLNPTLTKILALDGVSTSRTKALAYVSTFLKQMSSKHPHDVELASRIAIVAHESGEDAKPLLSDLTFHAGSGLPLALARVYHQDPSSARIDIATIRATLPDGWYKDAALMSAFKDQSPEQFQNLAREMRAQCKSWINKLVIYACLKVGLFAAGIAALLFLLREKPPANSQLSRQPYGFKTVYGCLLAVLQGQMVAGMFIFLLPPMNQSHKLIFVDALALLALLVAAGLAIQYLAYKPAGMRFRESIGLIKSPYYSYMGMFRLALFAFLAIAAAAPLAAMASQLLPNADTPFFNQISGHMYDAIASGDPLLIGVSFFTVAVLAPLAEEALFRGFFYRWLRGRWSVRASVIISSGLFALAHGNINGFLFIFVIGSVLALMYERSRSIIPGILTHSLWNTWMLLQLFLLTF